jgi:hypothetical protein
MVTKDTCCRVVKVPIDPFSNQVTIRSPLGQRALASY